MQRLLLLMATRTYRAKAFIRAARRLGGEVIIASEQKQALADLAPGRSLTLDFRHPERAVASIESFAAARPLDAIVGVDDDTTLVAAMASAALALPGNSAASVQAAQNKFRMRELLAKIDIPSPRFDLVSTQADAATLAARAGYPCVLKPVFLAGSRGVIRANDHAEFIAAFGRIAAILSDPAVRAQGGAWSESILVESFIPGREVALEGMLTRGKLQVLALFDKPDPLDGPYFEETIYLTPSRLEVAIQDSLVGTTLRAAEALGLREGPLHAELRVNADGAWIVELAARSIGGLCSTALQFSSGQSLEDLILRHALGVDISALRRDPEPAGVMMLPIARAGILKHVRGKSEAASLEGVEGIEITIPLGERLVPLPEGDRYLGFIFARGATVDAVETSLRAAHQRLKFDIEPEDPLRAAAMASGHPDTQALAGS
jgi:biotin carboxylase